MERTLHVHTPLVRSPALSKLLNDDVISCDVYLKMESSQPTGSFKMRGVGERANQAVLNGATHLIVASGGNAGLALSRAANVLKIPATAFIPSTASPKTIERIRNYGANVVVGGENFSITQENALLEAKKPGHVFISPYDHPDVWRGHSTLVNELVVQCPSKPGALVVAVGGGGLLVGVLEGLKAVGWADVPVIAMETMGAHCFNLSVQANKIVPMEKITSIAVCLGARTVTPHLMTILPEYNVISRVVTDKEAVVGCLRFLDDERVMVEPSCGAALAALYTGLVRSLVAEGRLTTLNKDHPLVMVVCGGSGITMAQLQKWAVQFDIPFPYST